MIDIATDRLDSPTHLALEKRSSGRPLVDMSRPTESRSLGARAGNSGFSHQREPVIENGYMHISDLFDHEGGRDGATYHGHDNPASGSSNDQFSQSMSQYVIRLSNEVSSLKKAVDQLVQSEHSQPGQSPGDGANSDVTNAMPRAGTSDSRGQPSTTAVSESTNPTPASTVSDSRTPPSPASTPLESTTPQPPASTPLESTTPQPPASTPPESTTPPAVSTPPESTTPQPPVRSTSDAPTPTTTATVSGANDNTSSTTATTSANFSVKNGQIIGPNGQPFVAKGLNIDGIVSNANENSILQNFPGLNFIRLNTSPNGAPYGSDGSAASGSDSISQIQQFINTMTSHGIVVEVEDHTAGGVPTGQNLTNETNWLSQIAAQNKNNPLVWFGTANEPGGATASIVAEQQADYNAIRSSGNNNMILLEPQYDTSTPTAPFTDNSELSSWTNVALDSHFYLSNGAGITWALQQYNGVDSADGQLPTIIGEYGPTVGQGGNPNAATGAGYAEAVQAAVNSGEVDGAVAWSFQDPNDPTGSNDWTNSDALTINQPANASGTQDGAALTSWGQEVESWISTGTVGTDAPT